jgi:ankyrin repeat protein
MMAAAANGSVDDEHGRSCIRIPDLAILRCLLDALPTCVADADARGRTALMLLCQLPQLALGQQNQQLMAVIALLLEHDPHALLRLAHDGSNALHLACHNTHAPTALLQLLSAHASATTTALPADWPMRRSTSIADNDDKDSTPILPPIFAMNDAKEWPAALYVRHHSPRDMAVLGALLPRISGAFTVHKDETAGARPPSLDCVWLLAGATSAVSSAPLPQPLSAAELEMFLDVAPLDARSITALCESSWLDEEMLRMLLLSSARRRKGDDSTDDDADGPRAFAAVVSGPNVSLPLLQLLVDAFPAERASAWSEGWPAVCSSSATSSDEESEAEQAQPEANEAVTLTAEIDGVTGSIVMALLTNPVVQTGPLSALPPLLDCVLQRCPQEVKKLSTGETNPLSSPPSLFSWMLSVQRKYSSSGSSGGGWLSMELVQVLMRHCPTVLSLPDNQGRVPLLAWLETLQANSPLQPLQLPAVAVAAATANASEDGSGADPDSVAAAVAAAAEAAATNLLNYLVSHTPAEAFLLRSRGPRGCSYALLALLQHPVPSKARHAELFALAALPRGHGGQVAVTTFAEEWLELLRSCLLPPSEADAVDQLLGALLDAMPELAEWTDKDTGGSLLHHAARAQRVRACETLVAAGVSKSLKDRSGATPLDLCMQTTTITNASSSSSASSESAACLAFFVNDVVNEAEQLRAQVARLTAERQALQDEVLLLRRRAATQTAAAAASTVASGASSMSNSPRRHHHLSHLHLPPLPQQLHHHHQRQHSHQHLHLRVQSEELSARSSALLTFESSTATGGWLGGAGGGSGGGGSGAASSSFAELQAENERLRAAAALQQRVGISTAAAARPSSPSASASAASTHSRSLSRAWSPMTERDVAEGANNNNNTRPNHRRGRSAVVAPAASSNSVDADPRDFEGTAAAAGTRGQPKRDSGCVVC